MNVERPPSVVCYLTSVRKFTDSMVHFRHQRRHGHGRMMCVVSVYVGPPRGRSEGWEGGSRGRRSRCRRREGTGLDGGDTPLLMPVTMLLMMTMALAMLIYDDDDDKDEVAGADDHDVSSKLIIGMSFVRKIISSLSTSMSTSFSSFSFFSFFSFAHFLLFSFFFPETQAFGFVTICQSGVANARDD